MPPASVEVRPDGNNIYEGNPNTLFCVSHASKPAPIIVWHLQCKCPISTFLHSFNMLKGNYKLIAKAVQHIKYIKPVSVDAFSMTISRSKQHLRKSSRWHVRRCRTQQWYYHQDLQCRGPGHQMDVGECICLCCIPTRNWFRKAIVPFA